MLNSPTLHSDDVNPPTTLRQNVLAAARRVVVKIGTQLLTSDPAAADRGRMDVDLDFVEDLARQIAALRQQGRQITLVSSGAIGCGCVEMGLTRRPRDVAAQQAVAAIGQRRLMAHMHEAFAAHGLGVGQVLLTRSDFDDRVRFLNIRNCITRLHELGCVPVLNENDTVAVDEIRFGDNDLLAALTCNALRADALVLLTVVEGLLDRRGRVIEMVERVEDHADLFQSGASRWGSGGMASKLEAARLVAGAGETAVIASGRRRNVLMDVLGGQAIGTLFVPAGPKLDSRSRWIGLTARPVGTLVIDQGAAAAVRRRGKSLLATGVTQVRGRFKRGDILMVRDERGAEVARGLTNYPADELRRIKGRRSSGFQKILGRPAYTEVIHRDNLVVSMEARPDT